MPFQALHQYKCNPLKTMGACPQWVSVNPFSPIPHLFFYPILFINISQSFVLLHQLANYLPFSWYPLPCNKSFFFTRGVTGDFSNPNWFIQHLFFLYPFCGLISKINSLEAFSVLCDFVLFLACLFCHRKCTLHQAWVQVQGEILE